MPRLKLITICCTRRSLKSTYAGSFVFDLHRKFLFLLDFAARKRNIFSRSALHDVYIDARMGTINFMFKIIIRKTVYS